MIYGIGVDCVEIDRFTLWHNYSPQQLSRIFSDDEVTYCLSSPTKIAERFAARFAAKEAFLKALTSGGLQIPLLYLCKHASVIKDKKNNSPLFIISNTLRQQLLVKNTIIHLSITHTKEYATAFVVIEKSNTTLLP